MFKVGDRVKRAYRHFDFSRRDPFMPNEKIGVVVGLNGPDSMFPYRVKWDSGNTFSYDNLEIELDENGIQRALKCLK